jgi:hypothetical protein
MTVVTTLCGTFGPRKPLDLLMELRCAWPRRGVARFAHWLPLAHRRFSLTNPIHRRPATKPQPAPTKAPAAGKAPASAKVPSSAKPQAATAPSAVYRFQDGMMEARRHGRVDLSGNGHPPTARASGKAEASPSTSGSLKLEGPRLLHLKDGWIPQGQGYDARRREVLTTYYKGKDSPLKERGVMLSVQNKNSYEETHRVLLGGKSKKDDPCPKHGGGVSTDGKYVYVADTQNIFVYSRKSIDNASKGRKDATVRPDHVMAVPDDKRNLQSNGSYMTVKDGYAYIGTYYHPGEKTGRDGGAVWRYEIDEKTGKLLKDTRQGPIKAPNKAQGISVVGNALLFTTGDRTLSYQPIVSNPKEFKVDSSVLINPVDIGNGKIEGYVQGFNIIGNEVWVTYESAAKAYIKTVIGNREKPQRFIQRIPLRELNLADLAVIGIDVEALKD